MIIAIIIIASREYFQQFSTCTRVNNLVYSGKNSNTHGIMVLIMFCSWKRFSQRAYYDFNRTCNSFASAHISHFELAGMALYIFGIPMEP
jgi:hypothetical protein